MQDIIELLGFCLHNIYFSFQGQFHEQVEGAAMESPVSPIVANLDMEHFERKVLSPATTPKAMDDMWMTLLSFNRREKQTFLEHINKVDPAIKFTVEGNKGNGAIPFLDTLAKSEADNTLSLKVYRKSTHTDQYLK